MLLVGNSKSRKFARGVSTRESTSVFPVVRDVKRRTSRKLIEKYA